ncbi:hypothetical protein [Streptomyces sp. NPDC054834]
MTEEESPPVADAGVYDESLEDEEVLEIEADDLVYEFVQEGGGDGNLPLTIVTVFGATVTAASVVAKAEIEKRTQVQKARIEAETKRQEIQAETHRTLIRENAETERERLRQQEPQQPPEPTA